MTTNVNRVGAVGGALFVVLNIAAVLVSGSPPDADGSAEDIAKWLADSSSGILANGMLAGLSIFGIAFWFGALWRKASAAEGGRPALSVTALLGLVLGGGMFLLQTVLWSAMALRDTEGGAAPVLWALALVAGSFAGLFTAILVVAISLLAWQTRMLPRWIVYLGALNAVIWIIAGFGATSAVTWLNALGGLGFALWGIWILGVSWELWRTPEPVA